MPGHKVDPHGFWSVIGFVGREALIAKGTALVRIPIGDIRKVGEYDKMTVLAHIRKFIERRHSGQKENPQGPNPNPGSNR